MNQPEAIEALLASYPRSRPPLSASQEAHYEEHYRRNRSGATGLFRLTAAIESWMHRTIAASPTGATILELGAGNLNHVPYEQRVLSYDAVEPMRALWKDSPYLPNIRRIYEDIALMEPERSYDRIISIAVLEHLTALPMVIARSGLLLGPGGRFQAGIPSEGGFLWGMAWRATTGVAYWLRHRENYGTLMRHEHVSTAREIEAVLGYFFEVVTVRRFPFSSRHLSFYTYLEAATPRIDRCSAFSAMLQSRASQS
jgi:SAM-dependent methyltransferase